MQFSCDVLYLLCEFESCSGEVDYIQQYVTKCVSDLRQVVGFLWDIQVSSANKNDRHDIIDIIDILLNVMLHTITLNSFFFTLSSSTRLTSNRIHMDQYFEDAVWPYLIWLKSDRPQLVVMSRLTHDQPMETLLEKS